MYDGTVLVCLMLENPLELKQRGSYFESNNLLYDAPIEK